MYTNFTELISDYTGPGFFFIQIGANDGITDDDLRRHVLLHCWRGLLVEPLCDVFSKLVYGYRGKDGLLFANVAVTSLDGFVNFMRHPSLPQCSGLGVRTRIQSRVSMEEVEVMSMTFETLLSSYRVVRLDLLQIDVEGYDGELVKLFPFDQITPLIVRYEHKHLDMLERHDVEGFLLKKGYLLFWEKNDTVAYLPL